MTDDHGIEAAQAERVRSIRALLDRAEELDQFITQTLARYHARPAFPLETRIAIAELQGVPAFAIDIMRAQMRAEQNAR